MPSVAEIWQTLTAWAPSKLAETWDNVGLQAGRPDKNVSNILVALDTSQELLKKAVDIKAQLVITHHPVLFNPIKSLDTSQYIPRLLAGFLRSDISLIACHTNLDSAKGGVSDLLANALELKNIKTLTETEAHDENTGIGRIGSLATPSTLKEITLSLLDFLKVPFLQVTGNMDMPISKIALCGGAGSDLWYVARDAGADLYISSEIKHHIAREAEQTGKAIIDAGHFYTEWPIVPAIVDYLKKQAVEQNWQLTVNIFEDEKPPMGLIINTELARRNIINNL